MVDKSVELVGKSVRVVNQLSSWVDCRLIFAQIALIIDQPAVIRNSPPASGLRITEHLIYGTLSGSCDVAISNPSILFSPIIFSNLLTFCVIFRFLKIFVLFVGAERAAEAHTRARRAQGGDCRGTRGLFTFFAFSV